MKRTLLDTNIILDIALKRDPFFDLSSKLFDFIDLRLIKGYVTASTITDIYYVARKEKGNVIAREFISNLVEIVEVLGIDKIIIIKALKSDLNDFEDAVQVSAAVQYELDIIVTRNKSDFHNSILEILSPAELIESLK
jgi:predicted nucleic acid-binding protein